MKHLLCALALGATLCGAGTAFAAAPLPGGYAVTLKGVMPDGSHLTRLAMYSFRPDGSLKRDMWEWSSSAAHWYSSTPGDYGSIGATIGTDTASSYPGSVDSTYPVWGSVKFASGVNATTTAATWVPIPPGTCASSADCTVRVTFPDGTTEKWKTTWSDAHLDKMELLDASYLAAGSSYYLAASGARDAAATNAGWGFGGPGIGFVTAVPLEALMSNGVSPAPALHGLSDRFNAWSCTSEGIVPQDLYLQSHFNATSTKVLRYVAWDNAVKSRHWVFSYFARPPGSTGTLATRVSYQTSHDFDDDGEVANNVGHIYSGLEVIDSTGKFRGFVFSDSSPNDESQPCSLDPIYNHTVSSLFYLDAATE